jgi:hypothetical protein
MARTPHYGEKVHKVCDGCGSAFTVQYKRRSQRFCSWDCQGTAVGEPWAFLAGAIEYQADECLLWPFAKIQGYGYLNKHGRNRRAHIVVCEAVHGPKPSAKHQVAHACGTPACVNPRHLRWDTVAGNLADKLIHGTHNRGERHNMAKLSADQVRAIRAQPGRLLRDLASEFGVSQAMISMIRNNKNWKHVE